MRSQVYMTRALRSADPRYARILSKLGYGRRDMVVTGAPQEAERDDIKTLREEYQRVIGRKPFNGWDADTLRQKIAAALAEA